MSDRAERSGHPDRRRWALAAITLAVNLGSFVFLALVARSSGPSVFGGLAALAGLALLFEVPANALQVAVGNRVGGAPLAVGALLLDASVLGVGACAVFLALSPLVQAFLHLPTLTAGLLLGGYALPIGVSVVPKGVLAGTGRLSTLAAGLLSGALVKIVLGVVLVRSAGGIEGAFQAMVWGEVVTAAVVLVGLRRLPRSGVSALQGTKAAAAKADEADGAGAAPARMNRVTAGRLRWGAAAVPAVAFTGYWAMTAADVVLGRHWLGPALSGQYAAAATAAQVALVVPGAIAALAFPRLVGSEAPRLVGPDTRPHQRLMLALASAAVAVTGSAAAVVVSVLARPVVDLLFGATYGGAASVVGLLSFAAALLGLVTVLVHYHLNRGGRVTAGLCWPGIAVAVVGTWIWHRSMTEIAVVSVVAASVVCATMLAVAFGRAERAPRSLVEAANLALLDAERDLTVVVPYYNPGRLLVPTMQRLLSVLDGSGTDYEVIAVSDGSTDGSDSELDSALAEHPHLTNVVLARNQGKGAALRIGLARGKGRYLGFIDADGDLDPILLNSFQTMVELYHPDIILGSKRHPLSEVEYPLLRRTYSWGYQQVVRLGFRLNIKDTQTGIKLVRRDVLSAVLPRMVEKRFAFDLELFVIARRLGYRRFLEAPIRLRHQFTSTVSWRSVYRSLLDTMAIWYRLRILHFYDGDQGPATPGGERLRIDPVVLRGGAGTAAGSARAPGRNGYGAPTGNAGARR